MSPHRDYPLGIKALRYAANFELPIEPNTWMAIIRASQRIIDYVPTARIMEEWAQRGRGKYGSS